jgi:hypothetical protein
MDASEPPPPPSPVAQGWRAGVVGAVFAAAVALSLGSMAAVRWLYDWAG